MRIPTVAYGLSLLLAFQLSCSPWYKKYGISSQNEVNSQASIPALLKAVTSENCRQDVYYASEALYSLAPETPEAAQAINQALNGSCGSSWGYYLARALGRTNTAGAPYLVQAASAPDGYIRLYAIQGMAEVKDPTPEMVGVLAQKVTSTDSLDVDYGAKKEAFTTLAKIGPKAAGALPALIALANDESFGITAITTVGDMGYPAPSVLDALNLLASKGPDWLQSYAQDAYNKLELKAKMLGVVADVEGLQRGLATSNPVPKASFVIPPTSSPISTPKPKTAPKSDIIIAIFDVEDVSQSMKQTVLNNLTIYLMNQVTQYTGYRIVPRDQLRSRISEQKSEAYTKQCFDASCQIELGRALAAQKILSTQLLKIGKQCMVVSNMFDLKTETTEKAASTKTNCSENELVGALEEIARQFAP